MDKLDVINQKIKFNPVLIHRLIAREAGRHINGLSEPCYSVDTKKFQYIIYRMNKIGRLLPRKVSIHLVQKAKVILLEFHSHSL